MTRGATILLLECLCLVGCGRETAETNDLFSVIGDEIREPLSSQLGDPIAGRAIFVERQRGHCVICHQLTTVDAPFQGDMGPPLDGIGDRLSAEQIRLRIASPATIWPETVMPSYYRTGRLNQVASEYQGQTILGAQEIEDLVAFLASQRSGMNDDER